MFAGFITIYAGVACVFVGAIALGLHVWLLRRSTEQNRAQKQYIPLVCAAVLLVNFPVAGGIVFSAIAIETRYTVVVENASSQPLEGVRITGGGCEASLDAIAPGSTKRCSFYVQHDDELTLSCVRGTTQPSHTIDGYITNGMGGYTSVTVNADGTVSVTNNSDD